MVVFSIPLVVVIQFLMSELVERFSEEGEVPTKGHKPQDLPSPTRELRLAAPKIGDENYKYKAYSWKQGE